MVLITTEQNTQRQSCVFCFDSKGKYANALYNQKRRGAETRQIPHESREGAAEVADVQIHTH